MEMNFMNTLPTYLFHTRNVSFSHFLLSAFRSFDYFYLLDYMLCLARQAYLGTSLYLTKHHCYTSLYRILVTCYQMTIKYSVVCSV